MKLSKILSIISALFGFTGSFIMCIGTLLINPKEIAGTYYKGNPYLLKSLISQKEEFMIGLIFITLSFTMQLGVTLFENRISTVELSGKKPHLILFPALTLCIAFIISSFLKELL